MIYEQFKPWEVSLAVIDITRTLLGFKKQQLKVHQLLHANVIQIQKCILEIYKQIKDDKEKAIKNLNVEESEINEALKTLDSYQEVFQKCRTSRISRRDKKKIKDLNQY
jgi:hypothetical protein